MVALPGVEPAVMMSTSENLMTGRPVAELIPENARREVAARNGGEAIALRLSDGLVDGLADSDEAHLRDVAVPWSETEEFFGQGDPEVLAQGVSELPGLARAAQGTGHHLYRWIRV
jgi:hypothetical protein